MIHVRDVFRKIRLSLQEEGEVHRLGAEIVKVVQNPQYDGRPFQVDLAVSQVEAQHDQTHRIACALQQRFGVDGWNVQIEPIADAFGQLGAYKLHFAIDPAALRTVQAEGKKSESSSLRGLHDELSKMYGSVDIADLVPPLPTKPVLSILLGTYNRIGHLQRAIASMRRSVGELSYEIVVCDGGSFDGSRAWLAAQPDVLLIGERRLEGAVKAFNQCYSLCRGEFIANLNDDAVVHGRALEKGVEHLRDNPNTGQVAFAFSGLAQPRRGVNDVYPRREHPKVTWGTTYANFGVARRNVVDKVAYIQGGFWNPVYRTYAGDCELSAWVWRMGYAVDKREDLFVEDAWAEDELREKNAQGSGDEAKRMYARWPAEAFRPDGPDPRVSPAELRRFHEVRGGKTQVQVSAQVDTLETMVEMVGLPAPEEERRLRKLAPLLRALDPVNTFPKRAEKLGRERVLHVHINGVKAVDQQEGLVRALKELVCAGATGAEQPVLGAYEMVRWTDFGHEERQEKILDAAKRLKPTLVFMQLQTPGAMDVATVKKLREISPGAVIATWNGDIASENAPWNTEWQVAFGRVVDLTMHSSMTHVRALRAAGVSNACYLQIGVDERQYHVPEDSDIVGMKAISDMQTFDVSFLGSRYKDDAFSSTYNWKNGNPAHDSTLRDEVVDKMREAFGDKFGLFGSGWGADSKVVPVTESHEVYWRSKIGLSVSLDNKLEMYSSDRLHKILGCGALLLVKRFPGMKVFGLDEDYNCLAFDTAEEAVYKAKFAVDTPIASSDGILPRSGLARGDREQIAEAGAALARNHHTWSVRMKELQPYLDAVRSVR